MPHPRAIFKKPEGRPTRGKTAAMKACGLKQWFIHAAEALARKGYKVNLQRRFLAKGYLIWELFDF